MKLIRAARFAGITALAAGIYTILVLKPVYLRLIDGPQQQNWFGEVLPRWALGGWIGLLFILAWMTLLVTFMYSYSPVHRVSTVMQSGLIIIAAVLLILCVLVGMNRFELAAIGDGGGKLPDAPVAYWQEPGIQIALTFLKAGLLMGGAVTAWISIDLALLGKLPAMWMAPGAIAGVLVTPAPFLPPSTGQLLIALAAFCIWCLTLGVRRSLPDSYPIFS